MSRAYSMSISIEGVANEKVTAVKAAAGKEWPFDDWFEHEGCLTASGDGSLCGGETENRFSRRLAKAVFEANGGPCQVVVDATCLEDLPYETYSFGEDEYGELCGPEKRAKGAPLKRKGIES